MKIVNTITSLASSTWARLVGMSMLLATDLVFAQNSGSFTDRVQNAKARSSAELLQGAKTGTDNYATIISLGAMLVGFAILIWGIMWVMAAGRSEGRKEAKPGWIMILGGGALGGASAIYIFTVGIASSLGA